MNLGPFSMSLAVKDIKASRAFYEKLGFKVFDGFDGKEEQNWLMLRNGSTKIGLFQGMFEDNILTFHPDTTAGDPEVRKIEADQVGKGLTMTTAAQGDSGPGHFILVDPDGNTIMVDQFQ